MIAYLQGTIRKKMAKSLIIDTGQIGYLVNVPSQILEKNSEKDEIELFIHTKVREDDISLYGFETLDQLDFFKSLIGINGIGAKLAMEILSQETGKVKSAIVKGDTQFLSKIPGIGKKTAARIIVELKNKIDINALELTGNGFQKEIDEDAMAALTGLGYHKYEINRILRKMPEDMKDAEEIVTYFLRNV